MTKLEAYDRKRRCSIATFRSPRGGNHTYFDLAPL